jgi:hypothetical protein
MLDARIRGGFERNTTGAAENHLRQSETVATNDTAGPLPRMPTVDRFGFRETGAHSVRLRELQRAPRRNHLIYGANRLMAARAGAYLHGR